MTPYRDHRQVVAYVNDSRWVASCPECNDGMLCWYDNPDACCLGCGHVFSVKFPAGAVKAAGLLLDRPEHARNWDAHKGESLQELERENDSMLGPKLVPLCEAVGLE